MSRKKKIETEIDPGWGIPEEVTDLIKKKNCIVFLEGRVISGHCLESIRVDALGYGSVIPNLAQTNDLNKEGRHPSRVSSDW